MESPKIFHWKSAKENGCGLWGKIWVKLGQCCEKSKETAISIVFCFYIFHIFALSYLYEEYMRNTKARSSDHRNT